MLIYQTMKNSDMTEGRGPMVPSYSFTTRKLAAEYIDKQPGLMGRKGKWSVEKYGDWEIREIRVLDCSPEQDKELQAEAKQNALRKLTEADKKVLGLI